MTAPVLLAIASLIAATPTSIAAMRWEKRIVLVSAPSGSDPHLEEQRHILAGWTAGAQDRDLAVIEIVGDTVTGTSDGAATLRRRFRLPAGTFAVALIGKDGHVKLRMARPISAAVLADTIDAMPMRRAGGR